MDVICLIVSISVSGGGLHAVIPRTHTDHQTERRKEITYGVLLAKQG